MCRLSSSAWSGLLRTLCALPLSPSAARTGQPRERGTATATHGRDGAGKGCEQQPKFRPAATLSSTIVVFPWCQAHVICRDGVPPQMQKMTFVLLSTSSPDAAVDECFDRATAGETSIEQQTRDGGPTRGRSRPETRALTFPSARHAPATRSNEQSRRRGARLQRPAQQRERRTTESCRCCLILRSFTLLCVRPQHIRPPDDACLL